MKSLRHTLALLVVLGAGAVASAKTFIYPVDAIDDFWTLGAEPFREKYAGIDITGLGVADEGWYVRYRHVNLTCLFGPLPDYEAARQKMWDMQTVRDAAIRNRPALANSEVDTVKFNYSGVFGQRGNTPYSGPKSDGKNGPLGDLDGDGVPNQLDDDVDGDGVPNQLDEDMDGDGIANSQDNFPHGTDPTGGAGGGAGQGGEGDLAGTGQQGDRAGQGNQQGGQGGEGSEQGGQQGMAGNQRGGQQGQQGQQGDQMGQQIAGMQGSRGSQGQQGSQQGQQGQQQGQQGQQQGQQGQQQGQQGQQGQPSQSQASGGGQGGQPSQSGPPMQSPQGEGNPLDLIVGLFRKILGL